MKMVGIKECLVETDFWNAHNKSNNMYLISKFYKIKLKVYYQSFKTLLLQTHILFILGSTLILYIYFFCFVNFTQIFIKMKLLVMDLYLNKKILYKLIFK